MTRPLNKREQKKLIRKAGEAKNRRLSIMSLCAFVVSLLLWVYPYIQYHWTIVDYKIPLAIFIFSGLLLGWPIKNYLNNMLQKNMFKASLGAFMLLGGSIVTSIFFLTNNLFSQTKVYSIKGVIVGTYVSATRGGIESVNAEVRFHHFTKMLSFPIEDEEKIDLANFVLLSVSKGGLGFEIIREKKLVE